MKKPILIAVPLLIAAATLTYLLTRRGDETVAHYGGAGQNWTLTEIDGAPFQATATLSFPEPGRIAGTGPCNGYSAEMTVPYPWFEATGIIATRAACPDMAAETVFMSALAAARFSEILNDTLILSNDSGAEMVFSAAD